MHPLLVLRANALACNPGNGIFHGDGWKFMGKEIGEINAKSFRPQHCLDVERRLGEIAKVDVDENRAGPAQLVEGSLHYSRHVPVQALPIVVARNTDSHAAQIGRGKFRLMRDRGMNERDVGDVARHRAGDVEGDYARHNPFDRIRLVGFRVGGAKTCNPGKMRRYPD